MSSKEYYLYLNIFIKIKQLLSGFKVNIDYKNISFMTDFESGLRKSIKEVFIGTPVYGYYFHFVKNLWIKQKKQYF